MIDDEKIIELFFERSEQGIRELDMKYGKICPHCKRERTYLIQGNECTIKEIEAETEE